MGKEGSDLLGGRLQLWKMSQNVGGNFSLGIQGLYSVLLKMHAQLVKVLIASLFVSTVSSPCGSPPLNPSLHVCGRPCKVSPIVCKYIVSFCRIYRIQGIKCRC